MFDLTGRTALVAGRGVGAAVAFLASEEASWVTGDHGLNGGSVTT